MATLTVRVELFGKAQEEDDEKLHEKMQAKRFFRVVKGEKGWYHLPSATCDHAADSSAPRGARSGMAHRQSGLE
jgi:hypothetical protein